MARQPWHFFINSFEVATRGSQTKALSLGANHHGKLSANQSDPVIAAMLASFTPVWDAYQAAYQSLSAVLGTYRGETQALRELFAQLNAKKLPFWEGQIFYHFPKGSTEAASILPRARRPFQKGTYDQRILAIKVLSKQCEDFPELQPVSADILAFHAQIDAARALQLSAGEGQAIALRSVLEAARVALCIALYGNLGGLMQHHREEPDQVAKYFKLRLVRKKKHKNTDEKEEKDDAIFEA